MDTKFSLLTHRALLRAAAPVIWPGGKILPLVFSSWGCFAAFFWGCAAISWFRPAPQRWGTSGSSCCWRRPFLASYTAAMRAADARWRKRPAGPPQNPFEEEECIRMEFGEEEMRFSSEHFDEFARCAALTRLVHCDGHDLLFSAPAVACAIDPKSLPAFEAFLQGKTGLTLETAR